MDTKQSKSSAAITDPESWVDQHGDYLFRYALMRVRDPKIAEDLVQETFLAALRSKERFSGRSSERTWFTGILKHKIIDQFRKSSREQPISDLGSEDDTNIERLFDEKGHWKIGPERWDTDPTKAHEQEEFWHTFQGCMQNLPVRIADAFSLRELEGLETEEICTTLDISKSNLWVMLHRARLQLRECLETNWFGGTKKN
jgi:RNA polymerase sigma-70 factor (ECF subfamily)